LIVTPVFQSAAGSVSGSYQLNKKGSIMKPAKNIRSVLIALVAIITLSSLSACVVVPARGYYGSPVVVHAWVRG